MNFQAFLVSKVGKALTFLISAGIAWLTAYLGAHWPGLHIEALINAVGGPLVVGLGVMLAIQEVLSWIQAHSAEKNIKAIAIIQQAINQEISSYPGVALQPLVVDGKLRQKTGEAINALMPLVKIPVDQIPVSKDKSDIVQKVALFIVACLALAFLFAGCAGDGGAHAAVTIPIPVPADQPEKQWRLKIDFGLFPPPDFALPFIDRPIVMGLSKDA